MELESPYCNSSCLFRSVQSNLIQPLCRCLRTKYQQNPTTHLQEAFCFASPSCWVWGTIVDSCVFHQTVVSSTLQTMQLVIGYKESVVFCKPSCLWHSENIHSQRSRRNALMFHRCIYPSYWKLVMNDSHTFPLLTQAEFKIALPHVPFISYSFSNCTSIRRW